MRCPECGSICWRNEIDTGVGIVSTDDWAIGMLLQPAGIVR